MNFTGVIIEESLTDKSVLNDVKIVSSKIEPVTEKHKTPWVKQWTLHDVEIPANKAVEVAEKISKALDRKHSWYADFKTDKEHLSSTVTKFFILPTALTKRSTTRRRSMVFPSGYRIIKWTFRLI